MNHSYDDRIFNEKEPRTWQYDGGDPRNSHPAFLQGSYQHRQPDFCNIYQPRLYNELATHRNTYSTDRPWFRPYDRRGRPWESRHDNVNNRIPEWKEIKRAEIKVGQSQSQGPNKTYNTVKCTQNVANTVNKVEKKITNVQNTNCVKTSICDSNGNKTFNRSGAIKIVLKKNSANIGSKSSNNGAVSVGDVKRISECNNTSSASGLGPKKTNVVVKTSSNCVKSGASFSANVKTVPVQYATRSDKNNKADTKGNSKTYTSKHQEENFITPKVVEVNNTPALPSAEKVNSEEPVSKENENIEPSSPVKTQSAQLVDSVEITVENIDTTSRFLSSNHEVLKNCDINEQELSVISTMPYDAKTENHKTEEILKEIDAIFGPEDDAGKNEGRSIALHIISEDSGFTLDTEITSNSTDSRISSNEIDKSENGTLDSRIGTEIPAGMLFSRRNSTQSNFQRPQDLDDIVERCRHLGQKVQESATKPSNINMDDLVHRCKMLGERVQATNVDRFNIDVGDMLIRVEQRLRKQRLRAESVSVEGSRVERMPLRQTKSLTNVFVGKHDISELEISKSLRDLKNADYKEELLQLFGSSEERMVILDDNDEGHMNREEVFKYLKGNEHLLISNSPREADYKDELLELMKTPQHSTNSADEGNVGSITEVSECDSTDVDCNTNLNDLKCHSEMEISTDSDDNIGQVKRKRKRCMKIDSSDDESGCESEKVDQRKQFKTKPNKSKYQKVKPDDRDSRYHKRRKTNYKTGENNRSRKNFTNNNKSKPSSDLSHKRSKQRSTSSSGTSPKISKSTDFKMLKQKMMELFGEVTDDEEQHSTLPTLLTATAPQLVVAVENGNQCKIEKLVNIDQAFMTAKGTNTSCAKNKPGLSKRHYEKKCSPKPVGINLKEVFPINKAEVVELDWVSQECFPLCKPEPITEFITCISVVEDGACLIAVSSQTSTILEVEVIDEDVIEIVPDIPTIDLTKEDNVTANPIHLENQEKSAGVITLYRSDENGFQDSEVQAVSTSITVNLPNETVNVRNDMGLSVSGKETEYQNDKIESRMLSKECHTTEQQISGQRHSINETVSKPPVQKIWRSQSVEEENNEAVNSILQLGEVNRESSGLEYSMSLLNTSNQRSEDTRQVLVSSITSTNHQQGILNGREQIAQTVHNTQRQREHFQFPSIIDPNRRPPSLIRLDSIDSCSQGCTAEEAQTCVPKPANHLQSVEEQIIGILSRHIYFYAHLCEAQANYVKYIRKAPCYKTFFDHELQLFETEKKFRKKAQSQRLFFDLERLNVRNVCDGKSANKVMNTIFVKLKEGLFFVSQHNIFIFLYSLMEPMEESFAKIPFFKNMFRLCGYIIQMFRNKLSANSIMTPQQKLDFEEFYRQLGKSKQVQSNLPSSNISKLQQNTLSTQSSSGAQQVANVAPKYPNYSIQTDLAERTNDGFTRANFLSTSNPANVKSNRQYNSSNRLCDGMNTSEQTGRSQQQNNVPVTLPQQMQSMSVYNNFNQLRQTQPDVTRYQCNASTNRQAVGYMNQFSGTVHHMNTSQLNDIQHKVCNPPPYQIRQSIAPNINARPYCSTNVNISTSQTHGIQQQTNSTTDHRFVQQQIQSPIELNISQRLQPEAQTMAGNASGQRNSNVNQNLSYTPQMPQYPYYQSYNNAACIPASEGLQYAKANVNQTHKPTLDSNFRIRLPFKTPLEALMSLNKSALQQTGINPSQAQQTNLISNVYAYQPQPHQSEQNQVGINQEYQVNSPTIVTQDRTSAISINPIRNNDIAISQTYPNVPGSDTQLVSKSPLVNKTSSAINSSQNVNQQQTNLISNVYSYKSQPHQSGQNQVGTNQEYPVNSLTIFAQDRTSAISVSPLPNNDIAISQTYPSAPTSNTQSASKAPPVKKTSRIINRSQNVNQTLTHTSSVPSRSPAQNISSGHLEVDLQSFLNFRRQTSVETASQPVNNINVPPSDGGQNLTQTQKSLPTTAQADFSKRSSTSRDRPNSEDEATSTIDLTWIDDIDDEQLQKDLQMVVKKEEPQNDEESMIVQSPSDSGISSPPFQVDDDTRVYTVSIEKLCICEVCDEKAQYRCICGDVSYCGKDCQFKNWDLHKTVCSKVKDVST